MTIRRNKDLDRLRAVAILFVLISHAMLALPWRIGQPPGLFAYTNFWTGVDLFFVISGFIVTKVLVGALRDARTRDQVWAAIKSFFVRRAFRIIPLAWLWVLLVLLMSLCFNTSNELPRPDTVISEFFAIALNIYNLADAFGWSLLSSNGYTRFAPYWSLSIEEQFYIFMPLLLLIVRSRIMRIVFLIGTLVFIVLALRPAMLAITDDINFYLKFTLSRMDPLVCGCLLYFLSSSDFHAKIEPSFLHRRFVAWAAFAFLAGIVAVVPSLIGPVLKPEKFVIIWPLLDLSCSLLVWTASYDRNYLFVSEYTEPLFQWLGSRSYALYLSHWPSIWITKEIGFRIAHLIDVSIGPQLTVLYGALFIAMALAFAELTHRLIERPMNRRGHEIAQSIDLRLAHQPSY